MNTAPYLPVDVVLDSKRATDPEQPIFDFEPQLENVVGYQLLWTNIPFSFYTLDDAGRSMVMGTPADPNDGLPAANAQVVTFRPGTYSPDTFRQQFKQQTSTVNLLDGSLYDCVIQPENAKLLIWNRGTTIGGEVPNFYITFNGASGPLARMLGFEPNKQYNSTTGQIFVNGSLVTNTANGNTVSYIEAPNVSNLLVSPYIALHAQFNGMRNDAARMDDGYDQLLATVPITGNFTSNLLYQGLPEPVNMGAVYTISSARLYLTHGDRGAYARYKNGVFEKFVNYLPLNGEGFQVCIRFYVDNGVKLPPR